MIRVEQLVLHVCVYLCVWTVSFELNYGYRLKFIATGENELNNCLEWGGWQWLNFRRPQLETKYIAASGKGWWTCCCMVTAISSEGFLLSSVRMTLVSCSLLAVDCIVCIYADTCKLGLAALQRVMHGLVSYLCGWACTQSDSTRVQHWRGQRIWLTALLSKGWYTCYRLHSCGR